jgi:hypothetical protein
MIVPLDFFQSAEVYQSGGEHWWAWDFSDRDHYWDYRIVPTQVNLHCEITSLAFRIDTNLKMIAIIKSQFSSAGTIRFFVIKAPGG